VPVLAIAVGVATIWQAHVSQRTLDFTQASMETSRQQSDAQHREIIAESRRTSNEALAQAEKSGRDALAETHRANEVALKVVANSGRQAAAAVADLEANQQLIRARVNPSAYILPQSPISPGTPFTTGVWFTNAGQSTAFDLLVVCAVGVQWTSAPFDPSKRPAMSGPGSRSNLERDGRQSCVLTMQPLSDAQIEALKSETLALYVWGTISYRHVFGTPKPSTFCGRLRKDLQGFSTCGTYNAAY